MIERKRTSTKTLGHKNDSHKDLLITADDIEHQTEKKTKNKHKTGPKSNIDDEFIQSVIPLKSYSRTSIRWDRILVVIFVLIIIVVGVVTFISLPSQKPVEISTPVNTNPTVTIAHDNSQPGNPRSSANPSASTSNDNKPSSNSQINITPVDNTTTVKPSTPQTKPDTTNTNSKPQNTVADTTTPILVSKPISFPSDSSVTIVWETDEKSTSFVKFGTDKSYPFPSSEVLKLETSHSIAINGLTPKTIYHYEVISKDAAGNEMMSEDYSFTTDSATGAAPYMGSKAPNFTLSTLDGKEVSLSQFRGKKVILNFWASWCSPCKIELPHLQEVWNKYNGSKNVMVLTVAGSQSDENEIRSFILDKNYTFTVCLDSNESAFNKYDLMSIPRTFFIDESGTIRRIQQGMFTSPGEIEFMLDSY
jgi:peroxiredoxin/cytoskeletal protein RodZ